MLLPVQFVRTAAALALATLVAAPAVAQVRDPVYSSARSEGKVGEKVDGYLGFVTPPGPELKKTIEDINIRRRAVYAEKAKTANATIEEYALTSGCLLISHTTPGEKYQAPDGTWQTRGPNPPLRDPRCP
ncbi:MAG: YdbL family protein [Chthoniobacter sp.]|nr:YdbL family protein [Chthoniobacter sp.]